MLVLIPQALDATWVKANVSLVKVILLLPPVVIGEDKQGPKGVGIYTD